MFSCPNCNTLVGEYPDAGVSTIVCAACTYKYELSAGTVATFTSHGVQVQAATQRERAQYAREFELGLQISPRERLKFTFSTARDDEWIHLSKGDEAVVVYGMRKGKRDGLLFIVNRSSSDRFVIGTPDASTRNLAAVVGVVAAVMSGGVAFVSASPAPFVMLAGLGGAVAAYLAAKPLLRPTHRLASDERAELGARRTLLEEKRSLLRLRAAVVDEMEVRLALRKQLDDLRTRMIAVKLDAYAPRIAAMDRAMTTLDAQLDVDRQLAAEYERTLEIIDIEYDVSVASDAVPTDGANIVATRRAELRAAEERRAETTRRLAANAEVEQLLRRDG
jgi:hypothetical protein